ncbi:hypothetical protein GWK47_039956 [Chionoecetes opilio]|uniref:Uncharacterized protein n=1 Tax=Chionoecetes opilio TaxID=41210 RepID=A0A8J5CXV1_CHIOP|nr:hypothetical protein GWK47_039956 [Chionoecetes opilio]
MTPNTSSHQPGMQSISPRARDGKPPFAPTKTQNPPHPPPPRQNAVNWDNTSFSRKAEKYTSRSQSNSWGEFDSGPHIHPPRQNLPGCAWGNAASARRALLDARGSAHLKSQVRSLMENSPPFIVLQPPVIIGLPPVQARAHGWPG